MRLWHWRKPPGFEQVNQTARQENREEQRQESAGARDIIDPDAVWKELLCPSGEARDHRASSSNFDREGL